MKILQVNCVYGYGSTGKIVQDIHKYLLGNGHQSIVCYGRNKNSEENNVYKVSSELGAKVHSVQSRLFGVEFAHSFFSTQKIINIIKLEKPDVVHLHCLNGHFVDVYKLMDYLKSHNIKTVFTLHAEIMHTAGCEHAMDCEKWKSCCYDCNKIKGIVSSHFLDDAKRCYKKMQKAFSGFNNLTVVGVSQWITDRAKQSPIMSGLKFSTVHNGLDANVFSPKDFTELKRKLKLGDKKIVLHVTPSFNHPIKGGKYVIELAKIMPDYQFIIVGFNGDVELLPCNIIPISHTKDKEELAQYYSMADCSICTSLRESYSSVCIESMSCGCKVVAFDVGGIPETFTNGMGTVVELFDIIQFKKEIEKWCDISVDDKIKSSANQMNSSRFMVEKYLNIYGG